jgi:hypothetical protein
MIRQYRVKLEGLTPLLMHWDNIDWADQMEQWKSDPANRKGSKAGDDRSPAFRWIGSVYHNGSEVCVASDNLSRCLMEGGAMVPVPGGKSGKTFKSQTQSGMRVDEMFVPLQVGGKTIPWKPISQLMVEPSFSAHIETAKKLGFRLFTKRARIGQSKHIRVRPRFEGWTLEFSISVWDDQITEDVLQSLFDYAGTYKGLCDWRPGSKTPGPYGMFKLVSCQKI